VAVAGSFRVRSQGELGGVTDKCGVPKLGKILQDTATKLHEDSIASIVGEVVQMFVGGSDVVLDLQKMIVDLEKEQWAELGKDLGKVSDRVTATGCNSFVCHLVEGILTEADMVLTDLKPCEADLREAEKKFIAGTTSFANNQPGTAVKYWGTSLNILANAMTDCGVAKELAYLAHEANVLGLGNATVLGDVSAVLVHGADFYKTLYDGVQDMGKHDYRSAGQKLGKILKEMDDWTKGNLCSSGACYVLSGIMQYLQELKGDARACKADVEGSFGNFSAAVRLMVTPTGKTVEFSTHSTKITEGIHEIGNGLKSLSDAVGRCHLSALAEMLAAAAVKFGLQPEIGWVESLLHILIDGKDIILDTANACLDFASNNWPGFGYNVAKLVQLLIGNLRLENTDAAHESSMAVFI